MEKLLVQIEQHDICNIEGDVGNYLHSCNGKRYNGCDFHVHLNCLKKNKKAKKCKCKLKQYDLQQNEEVFFHKNHIRGILSWTDNVENLIEKYRIVKNDVL